MTFYGESFRLQTIPPGPSSRFLRTASIHQLSRDPGKEFDQRPWLACGGRNTHSWLDTSNAAPEQWLPCHASVRENLLNQAYRFANLTDHELVENGLSKTLDFAPFRVSSAALTVGFMNALGIDSLRAIEVNMAGGILLESDFWSSQR